MVAFYVFAEGTSSYRPTFRYAPQQGLTAALSQYAPGKQLYIGNKRWTSGALYSPMKDEFRKAWDDKALYLHCMECGYAKRESLEEGGIAKYGVLDCPACGAEGSFGKARYWIKPPGFAHPFDLPPDTTPDAPFAQSYATRAKLATAVRGEEAARTLPFTDRVQGWIARDHLLVTNRGPRDEGYDLCVACGRIARSAQGSSELDGPHPKPFPTKPEERTCPGRVSRGIVLGTQFISDILLLSFQLDPTQGVRLPPGSLGTEVALRTVCEALAQAACDLLQIEQGEIEAEYRPALTPNGKLGAEVEIYLYDTLPGGAGFSHIAGTHGADLLQAALDRLSNCPEGCDASCYRCLRRFTNRFEHDRLDRHVGAALLRYLLHGDMPSVPDSRRRQAIDLLAADLKRGVRPDEKVETDFQVDIDGLGPVIVPIRLSNEAGAVLDVAISSPLAPDVPSSPSLRDASDLGQLRVLPLDEMLVRRNTARAVQHIFDRFRS